MAVLASKPAAPRSTREPIVITVGLTQPALFDLIANDDGSAIDLEGKTILFSMRPLLSRTPVVDGAAGDAVEDQPGINVTYEWEIEDTAIEGTYMGWWGVDDSGDLQETEEFPIVISDHGPGFGAPIGPVVDGIAQWMPTTFHALRSDPGFGDRFLQRFADRAKRMTMGVVVVPDEEINYDPQLIDYLSKLAAMSLIAPAKDFWGRQWRTRSVQSPVEIESYPDMLVALDKLYAQLSGELPGDLRQLRQYVPGLPVAVSSVGPSSTLDDTFHNTPDPRFTRRPQLGGPYRAGGFFS